jgi:hypothetical protein
MATIASPAAARMKSDRIFYTGAGLAIAGTIIWGFAPTFYLSHWLASPPGTPSIGLLLALHGTIFSAWMALMVVQPLLIARRNLAVHRALGLFGVGVAAAMVVLGNVAGIVAMNVGFQGVGDPFVFYALPFFGINAFAVTVWLAFRWRRFPDTHKRLILLANCNVIGAAIARIPLDLVQAGAPFSFIFGPDLIILAGMLYDWRSRGRVHRVWLVGGALVVASQVAMMASMGTAWWHAFAESMAALAR